MPPAATAFVAARARLRVPATINHCGWQPGGTMQSLHMRGMLRVSAAMVFALLAACSKRERDDHTTSAPAPWQPPGVTLAVKPRALTALEKEDLEYLRANTKLGAPYRLDLAQPNQYRYVMSALARIGESPKRSPQFFRSLAAGQKSGKGNAPTLAVAFDNGTPTPQDLNYIDQFALNVAPGTFSATGLSSVLNGTERTTIIMELYDTSASYVYATNQNTTTQFAQGTNFQVPVSGTVPSQFSDKTTEAQALIAYVPQGGDPNNPVVVMYRSQDTVNPSAGCMLTPNYCVRNTPGGNCVLPVQYQTTCTNQVANTTYIKVCYVRGGQQECDYFNQGPAHPTNFVFPSNGSLTYPNAVVTPATGYVTITLKNPLKGGGCYLVFQQLAPLAPANWTANGQTLTWNYPAASFPDPNQCLEFYNGTNTIMQVTGSVALQGGSGPPPFGQFNFTSDRTQIGQPGVYIIPGIQIQQGCFAEGTRIRMADGSERTIESFTGDHNESVRNGLGEGAIVRSTSTGSEPLPMVRIRTEGGQDVLVTHTHPILTVLGTVMARDVAVGDHVRTESGVSRVIEVTRENYAGRVYNLRLSEGDSGQGDASAFFANGILAGDMATQWQVEQAELNARARSPVDVLERLAPAWHEDFRRQQAFLLRDQH
jgi:hypothetical protein